MSEILLEVKNLKKYFKSPGGMVHAVDDCSFSINGSGVQLLVYVTSCPVLPVAAAQAGQKKKSVSLSRRSGSGRVFSFIAKL